jgi:anti-sigma regulatory factor (Ser/Thr protein kinase)
MPEFVVPANPSIRAARALFGGNDFFRREGDEAVLRYGRASSRRESLSDAMIGAWTGWCRAEGYPLRVKNEPSRMSSRLQRVLPATQVRTQAESTTVLEEISAKLELHDDPEGLAAVRFCLSELTRNVLEHANSPEGAFVAAQHLADDESRRVTIAVADCGQGIPAHLSHAHPQVNDELSALGMAMRPGITGALPGTYGTPNNAGAGLYITRSIAKATGGYFLIVSGHAAYRLRRARSENDRTRLFVDAFDDPRSDRWMLTSPWNGTVVSVEIGMGSIAHYENLMEWVLKHVPRRTAGRRRIRFT